jgi:5-methyltetrahydropteroyltriglutamate--homocysteine methyltransferase
VIEAHLAGVFPRSEQLVQATRGFARGKTSQSELESAFHHDYEELASLQRENDLRYFVDGQLNWQDLFRPFSTIFTGIQTGGLARWFDNNAFYRKPTVTGKVNFSGANPGPYFKSGYLPTGTKAILPGPFTFAALSQNTGYGSVADLVDDMAHSMKDLIEQLRKSGYEYFQFDEPCLSAGGITRRDLEIARHAFEVCAKGLTAKTLVHTYFGDAAPVIDALLDYPVDCIGLDFYATSIDSLREHSFNRELACGCIDGRNSLLESPPALVRFVERASETLEPRSLSICPNSDLQFLPCTIAQKKVRLLSDVSKKMES